MFTISLHQIKIIAPIGLYSQEQVLNNLFEVDIDVDVKDYDEKRFVDYTLLNELIHKAFCQDEKILEVLALKIFKATKDQFPFVQRIKIALRKMNPPMQGDISYAQVVFEK